MLTSLYEFDKKLTKLFPENIYRLKVQIVTLRKNVKCFKVYWKDTSKTAVNYSSTLDNKLEKSLHFVSVLQLPFSTSK